MSNDLNGVLGVAIEDVPTPPPAPAPKATQLEELDRYKIENLYMKTENIRLQTERLQADLIQASQLRQGLQQELLALKKSLGEKYGVDLDQVKILADGTIIHPTQGS